MLFKVAGAARWNCVLGGVPGLACLGVVASLCLLAAGLVGGFGFLALPQASAPLAVTQLQALVTLQPQLATAGGQQEVRVEVQDQAQRPISGASMVLTVHELDKERPFTLPETDAHGQTSLVYTVNAAPPGTIIPIKFRLSYQGCPTVQIVASYLVWDGPEAKPTPSNPIANVRVDCAGQEHRPIRLALFAGLQVGQPGR